MSAVITRTRPLWTTSGSDLARSAVGIFLAIGNTCYMPLPRVRASATDHSGTDPVVDPVIDAVLHASRALVAVAARSIAAVAEDVTLPQYRVLVLLAGHSPQGVAELATSIDVSPSTVTRMCDRLVGKGLVRRRVSSTDRRQVQLGLTAEGRGVVQKVTDHRRTEIARIVQALPHSQRSQLVNALEIFANSAGELSDEDWTAGWAL